MPETPVFQTRDLHKHFRQGDTEIHALSGIDLTVDPGEFVVIAGPSGSGKSTLLNILGLLDTATRGEVRLDGRDVAGRSKAELAALRRDKLGFVFQAYNLMPVLTARENVELVMEFRGVPPAERRRRSSEVLTQLGLAELVDRFPEQMSGGQQQRVAVARAIAGSPSVVLADEPTANLDSVSASALMDLLDSLNTEHGVCFVLSSHDPRVITRARRIVTLRDGRVTSDEPGPMGRKTAAAQARRPTVAQHA
jgi:putative ABC transport system ATP-binding protein